MIWESPPYVDTSDRLSAWRDWVCRTFRSADFENSELAARVKLLEDRLLALVAGISKDVQANPKTMDAIPETARTVAEFAMLDMEERK
jgi:hypothetical protein